MFEINVTIHCPDLVAAAKLLAKCTGTAVSEVPAAPAPVVAPSAPAVQATAPAVQATAPAQLQHPVTNPITPASPTTSTGYPSEAFAPAVPAPAVPLAQAPTFTLAEISKAGADLIGANPGLLPKVNELLAQYGIQTLDKLKPDQFGAFATALRGLGAKI